MGSLVKVKGWFYPPYQAAIEVLTLSYQAVGVAVITSFKGLVKVT